MQKKIEVLRASDEDFEALRKQAEANGLLCVDRRYRLRTWQVVFIALLVAYGVTARYCDVKQSLGFECARACR